jgi:hypothetical protein
MTPEETLNTLLDKINTEIERQRATLTEGVASELGELGPLLQQLSAMLPNLDTATGKAALAKLEQLHFSLGEISSDYSRQQEDARNGITQIGTRLKAATAYTKSSFAAPPPPSSTDEQDK